MAPKEDTPGNSKKPSLSVNKRRLLEQRLKRTVRLADSKKVGGIPKRPTDSKALASLGQARLWVLNDFSDGSPSYNITSSFKIDSPICQKSLTYALNQIVARHETLRSSYRLENGEVLQSISEQLELSLHTKDCKNEEHASKEAQKFGRTPFNLKRSPLLSLGLFSASEKSHILILSIHHIISDNWSLKLFWSEFSQFYAYSINKIALNLPLLSIQFSDFSHWQRDWLEGEEKRKQIDYWKNALRNPPSPIALPTDFPYPNQVGDKGSLEHGNISLSASKKIKAFSAANDVSPFSTLILGFSILLSRYSDSEDILISSPVANRRKQETANLIGFFLNTLVIRADLSNDPTVNEALGRMRKAVLGALENQDLPTNDLVDTLKPPRVAGRHPLFQTMFVFQREDEGTPKLHLDGCAVSPTFIDTKTSKFDLSLFVVESDDQFETLIEYRTDIFKPETIQRFLQHYSTVMEDLIEHPSRKISELEILTKAEQRTLVEKQNGDKIPLENLDSIPRQIADYSLSHPNEIALAYKNEKVTYLQLETDVARLARYLIEQGASPNNPIGVYMERSKEAIIAIIAIIRSGAPYLPLDPSYPNNRIKTILDDATPFAIITESHHENTLRGFCDAKLVNIDSTPNNKIPLPEIEPTDLAYIIYTSGSTGTPKGVAITHSNLQYSTSSRNHYYRRSPECFLLLSSISFDSSVAGIFWALTSGGTLVITPSGEEHDTHAVRKIIDENQVATLLCIPSLYREIISLEPYTLGSLHTAIMAGEPCPKELVHLHDNQLPHCSLHNEYGPTEATVWCSATSLSKDEPVTIGKAITNYSLHVFNKYGHLLPIGIPGELYIAGPGVAQGYYKNESLTSDKFPTILLPDGTKKRMYRTGDKVRQRPDGSLEFLGRFDNQVKIRGFRIELGEIDKALGDEPNTIEAISHVVEEKINDQISHRLIAFIVVSEHYVLDRNAQKRRLAKQLPTHAIPTQTVVLNSIPRLPNGKIDRKALPIPSRDDREHTRFQTPTSKTETELVKIWKEILSLEKVSTTEDFFEIGGTSLQAIRLFSKIKENFDTSLSPSKLLQAPTVADLAKLIDKKDTNPDLKNIVSLQEGDDLSPIILVHAAGQELIFYRNLVKRIDKRIPIFGIQPIGHDGTERPTEDFEKIIDRYTSEILAVQESGPYRIIGHCQGGVFALEIARRLKAKGKAISLVVSIDGEAPIISKQTTQTIQGKRSSFVVRKMRGVKWRTNRLIANLQYRFYIKFGSNENKTKAIYKESFLAVTNSINRRTTVPYDFGVFVLQCRDSEVYPRHSDTEWREAVPKVQFIRFDCLHNEILEEPHVAQTSTCIMQKYFKHD